MMEGKIELERMEFWAYHGCLEKERREGNLFTVDFSCLLDISAAAVSDNLEDTVDYGKIYLLVREQMVRPSNLLENVAWRIVESVSSEFPHLYDFKVRVSKKNPPVEGPTGWSRVTVRYKTQKEE